MEKKTETIIKGYRGISIRIHSFIPSLPEIRLRNLSYISVCDLGLGTTMKTQMEHEMQIGVM